MLFRSKFIKRLILFKRCEQCNNHSNLIVKVKLKPDGQECNNEEVIHPGTSAKDLKAEALRRKANKNAELPVIGSTEEYAKLPKSKTTEVEKTVESSSDESEEEEGDGLWSAIMGQ